MNTEKTKRKTNHYFWFVMVVLLIFQQAASKIGIIIAQLFDYSRIDPNNTFAYISVHHIVQMILAIATIYAAYKLLYLNFNLRWSFSKIGIKYTVIFTIIIFAYVLFSYIIGYKMNSISQYDYPLNAANILGTLGFQLLLSGPSEEILFRALPIPILLYFWLPNGSKSPRAPIICSALLFSLAHINWTLFPFSLQINWFKLIYAFILGLIYGITYIKSESIVYPMIMHSISNVLMVGTGYLFMCFNK